MNILESISELTRAVRDLIRIGVILEVQYTPPCCRVQLGGNTTDWLQWLARRAGGVRAWWAPSVGEQVVVLVLSGELNATFVLLVINYQEGLRDRPDHHSRDLQYGVRPLLGSVRLTGRLWKMLSSPN
ncbi:phage baseplate assembly protein V [Serratia ureilytica]|uniref:phage baseplate assembly protein V n=1 Tax=Serratia ureilytica TaxID=300181 RepID=UPI00313D1E6E